MEFLVAHNLTVAHGNDVVLEGVSLTVRSGDRIGLVGRNGSGKSSLLATLAGTLPPAEGDVRRAPGLRLGYLRQAHDLRGATVRDAAASGLSHLRELEQQLRREEERLARDPSRLRAYGDLLELFEQAGGYQADADLDATLAAFGFPPARHEQPVDTLSGGERTRLALAAVLLSRPELLLLDEPTNHLDLAMRQWLTERLRAHHGAVIVASHDRALLDAVSRDTIWLERGRLLRQRGSYSRARRDRAAHARGAERRRREAEKEDARLRATAAQLRSWGNAGAQRQRRQLERRQRQNEGRHTGSPGAAAPSSRPSPRSPGRSLPGRSHPAEGTLLSAKQLSAYDPDGRPLFRNVDLRIDAGDRLALLGANGSGKSSLLQLLAGEKTSEDPQAEVTLATEARLAVFDQHLRGLRPGVPLLEQLEQFVRAPRARELLALAGVPADRWQAPPEELSGGQRGRAGLALLIASEANLLLLDEPTNDLDIAAIELLEATLRDHDAAMVLVTHDLALAEAVAERFLVLRDGTLQHYPTLRALLRGGPPLPLEPPAPSREGSGSSAAADNLPDDDELAALEREELALEAALLDPVALAERERRRLSEQLAATRRARFEAYGAYYQARFPPAEPRLRVREAGIRVGATPTSIGAAAGEGATSLDFEAPGGVQIAVRCHEQVAHLVVSPPPGSRLLPWAQRALFDAAVRLIFYALPVTVVQTFSEDDLRGTLLEPAGGPWWASTRTHFTHLEGWSSKPRRRRKQLAHHPDWEDWAAFRHERRRRHRVRRRRPLRRH